MPYIHTTAHNVYWLINYCYTDAMAVWCVHRPWSNVNIIFLISWLPCKNSTLTATYQAVATTVLSNENKLLLPFLIKCSAMFSVSSQFYGFPYTLSLIHI